MILLIYKVFRILRRFKFEDANKAESCCATG